jgi:hypothetical protein
MSTGNLVELCRWDAAETPSPISPAAPPTGSSRIDLVVLQVQDNAIDAGGNNTFIFQVIAGTVATPGPGPVPAVPANAYPMAQYTVPGGAVNLNGVAVTDRRVSSLLAGVGLGVRARACLTAAWTSAGTNVPFNVISYNIGGGTWAGGVYTAPVAGDYLCVAALRLNSTAAGQNSLVGILHNGAVQAIGSSSWSQGAGAGQSSYCTDVVTCAAGDTISAYSYSTAGMGADVADTGRSFLTVRQIA